MAVFTIREIESLDQWIALAAELRAAGYTLYQLQYDADGPEGFHAWFWASKRPQVHIMTHNAHVQQAIIKY